jgi:hypothetical protein
MHRGVAVHKGTYAAARVPQSARPAVGLAHRASASASGVAFRPHPSPKPRSPGQIPLRGNDLRQVARGRSWSGLWLSVLRQTCTLDATAGEPAPVVLRMERRGLGHGAPDRVSEVQDHRSQVGIRRLPCSTISRRAAIFWLNAWLGFAATNGVGGGTRCGWLAQLVRAPVSHTGGHRFESCTAHSHCGSVTVDCGFGSLSRARRRGGRFTRSASLDRQSANA